VSAGPHAPAPYFVGGTGRSGTTVVARLIGARAEVTLVPIELRFHVDRGGLADLSAGRVTVDQFARRMRKKWFERSPRNGPRGLHVIATRQQMRRGLRRLREAHADDPWLASRRFMQDMVRPFCRESGTPTWVEMTPPNANAADALCRMFPRGRVVHAVRDGRDVAASVAVQPWGPNAVETALVWWANKLMAIHESVGRADPARVRIVRLESLVGPNREEEYAGLVEFLGRGPDAGMRAFFDRELTAERSRRGTWRDGLDATAQAAINELYEQQLARLADRGVTVPPIR
jgi:Sulfotransferase family